MRSALLSVMSLCVLLSSAVAENAAPNGSFREFVERDREAFEKHKRGETIEPGDAVAIETELKALCEALDTQQRGSRLGDRDFALAMFQQVMGDNPTELVLDLMQDLLRGDWHDEDCVVKIPRSGLVPLLLMAKENGAMVTMNLLADNLPLLRGLDLETKPRWQPPRAAPEPPLDDAPQPLSRQAHTGQYKLYYGYMHAHTSLSDGKGKPRDAYRMARDDAKLDFFAVTDHALSIPMWPWDAKWNRTGKVADEFNEDGRFVALRGFEWSSPTFRHINVLGTVSFTTCLVSPTMGSFYSWLRSHPEAVCRFNHPGYADKLDMEFEHFALSMRVVDQMVGIEMFNKDRGIDVFFNKGYGKGRRFLDEAIAKGWFTGVVGGQDNHRRNWGIRSSDRVGVWAKSLTREGILDAYRGRRTFVTEDSDLSLSFTANRAQMGSRLPPGAMTFLIGIEDGDREGLAEAELYKGGKVIKQWQLGSADANITFRDSAVAGDYYYVLVAQSDGDQALSSPIWIVP